MAARVAARAADPRDLGKVEEAVRDHAFRVASVRHDPAARTVTIPFDVRFPRRVPWEFVVRRVRSLEISGRMAQEQDYIRALRWDPAGRAILVECVLAQYRIPVEAVAVEALCLAPEEGRGVGDADHPEWFRREVDERGSELLGRRERHARAERKRTAALAGFAAVIALVFGLVFGNPWWALLLNLLAGGAGGWVLARKRSDFPAAGMVVFGIPGMGLSCTGEMFRQMTTANGHVGMVFFPLWLFHALAGAFLVKMNESFMVKAEAETEGQVWRPPEGPGAPPADPWLHWKAGGIVGGGSGLLFGILSAPRPVWLGAAPVAAGIAATLVARLRPDPERGGSVLAAVAAALALASVGPRGMLLPAALLAVALHYAAGVLVVFHARGEGR